MTRELQAHLFSPDPKSFGASFDSELELPSVQAGAAKTLDQGMGIDRLGLNQTRDEVSELKIQIRKMQDVVNQFDRQLKAIDAKADFDLGNARCELLEIKNFLQQGERDQSTLRTELAQKFHWIEQKLRDREVQDLKIQEIVDRHNSISKVFEARIVGLQRIISEQEMALHAAHSALQEIRQRK